MKAERAEKWINCFECKVMVQSLTKVGKLNSWWHPSVFHSTQRELMRDGSGSRIFVLGSATSGFEKVLLWVSKWSTMDSTPVDIWLPSRKIYSPIVYVNLIWTIIIPFHKKNLFSLEFFSILKLRIANKKKPNDVCSQFQFD